MENETILKELTQRNDHKRPDKEMSHEHLRRCNNRCRAESTLH